MTPADDLTLISYKRNSILSSLEAFMHNNNVQCMSW